MPEILDGLASPRRRPKDAVKLFRNIKHRLSRLEEMPALVKDPCALVDGFSRFHQQSFKVYALQGMTGEVCQTLRSLLRDGPMNRRFPEGAAPGSGHDFELSRNQGGLHHPRPILEKFFRAYYFLKRVVNYGRELDAPPRLPARRTGQPSCMHSI